MKIALLIGGFGSEREVSLNSGDNVFNNLNKNKYEIIKYDFRDDFNKFIKDCLDKKIDLVFPVLHGENGEDGRLQGFLEILKMPYIFSDALSSAISMNKYKSKLIIKDIGEIKLAKDIIIKKDQNFNIDKIIEEIKLPLVVKPTESGSSVGVSIVKDKNELEKIIIETFKYGKEIIIEEFIKGREITVPVFQNKNEVKSLPVIEIIPQISSWFDYEAKYKDNGSLEICPANIDDDVSKKVQLISEEIFKKIGCSDLARVDYIMTEGKELYFLEINTIPGLTKNSLTPKALKAINISMEEFLEKLIENNIK